MNYYERHLGDYAKDTAHLSIMEHGVYGLLLDRYYSTEQGIPEDQAHRVARARTKEEKLAVDTVLSEFFKLADGIWINGRAEEEITKAQSKIKAAKENGKRGGRPKTNQKQTQEKPTGFSVGSETETQSKALQTPDTRHQYESFESVGSPNSFGENQIPPLSPENAGPDPFPESSPGPSRAGLLCRRLRDVGIDAAPHKLAENDWQDILAKRTDDEIVAYAETVKASKPAGKRITLGYLAPGLLEDPKPIDRQQAKQPAYGGNSAVDRVRRANPLPGDEIQTTPGRLIEAYQ